MAAPGPDQPGRAGHRADARRPRRSRPAADRDPGSGRQPDRDGGGASGRTDGRSYAHPARRTDHLRVEGLGLADRGAGRRGGGRSGSILPRRSARRRGRQPGRLHRARPAARTERSRGCVPGAGRVGGPDAGPGRAYAVAHGPVSDHRRSAMRWSPAPTRGGTSPRTSPPCPGRRSPSSPRAPAAAPRPCRTSATRPCRC